MIITRTPLRATLGGGGTDLPSYYERHGGFIFGMGLSRHLYIMLNAPTLDDGVRLHHSESETVDHVSELRHELAREALRLHGIERRVEISSLADLPHGTGLGSSSAYVVGLLAAIHEYKRSYVTADALAEEACHIELGLLGKRIGKQDQYMAAYGGLTVLDIARDGVVAVRSVTLPGGAVDEFVANTHLYYTGQRRDAVAVLRDQDTAMSAQGTPRQHIVAESLHRIKELGHHILEAVRARDYDRWGMLLHEHWQHKRRMSPKISLSLVDELYERVRRDYGVLGGKISGAGGGGFLMLYCPRGHERLEAFMAAQGLRRLHYTIEHEGVTVIPAAASVRAVPGRRPKVRAVD